MTDAPTAAQALRPAALIAVDIWGAFDAVAARLGEALGGALPDLLRSADVGGGWRALRVEPTVWWLIGPLTGLEAGFAAAEAALGEDGAAVDLSGGLARLEIAGPGWRELL